MNRRDFLKKAVLSTGMGLVVLPSWARGAAPSDQIRTGHIGVGGMGSGHVDWFRHERDVRVVALCDVDAARCAEKVKLIHDFYKNDEAKGYRDFRELLDRQDIDAISTATPDHWRALIVTSAFQAGKDVYAEKPLAHNYREAHAMLTMGRRYARVYQLGTQIHNGDNYHRVVELVRSGVLGKIHTVRVWSDGGAGVIREVGPQPIPPTLDYDRWLGPAPWRPYHPAHVHFNFRYFLDYSCGHYADFWCHISDIAFWALDIQAEPLTVAARGELQGDPPPPPPPPSSDGKPIPPKPPQPGCMSDAPKWIDVDLEFPGLKYLWTTRRPDIPQVGGRGMACYFEGTNGTLVCDYGTREIFLGNERLTDIQTVPRWLPRPPSHHRNFLDCVRSRALTESNLPYAVRMTTPMFFGRISLLTGRPLKWDAEKKEFAGDPEATRLLGRVYREPWVLPV